ncbi:MAG: cyclase family protein [Nanoarchaeota archaeon]|nr:cyclase family protein [Nanoarchaeota archaeon]
MILDLTMPIDARTPVFPGDPQQEIRQIATIEKNGWNEKRLSFNSHFGTHIDAPYHMLENGKKLTDFPIEWFVGKACVIDVRGQKEIFAPLDNFQDCMMVFFLTDHIRYVYSPKYFSENPVIGTKMAGELIKHKVKIVGLDSFTPDNAPYDVHKLLFKHNIRIVENLVNLEKLVGKTFLCHILPLKIQDADGAPCRVIATLD